MFKQRSNDVMEINQLQHDPKLDIKRALRAFNAVQSNGELEDGTWHWMGLKAYTDLDGYTMYLESNHAKLVVYFHNKYMVEYTDNPGLDELYTLIDRIVEKIEH
jgi:hypothetical protein